MAARGLAGHARGNGADPDQLARGGSRPAAIESIRKHGALYCIAVGGAAYLVSKAIRASKVLAFADLGMEAIHEFEVRDMPVIVAVDSTGEALHKTGPAQWRGKSPRIPVVAA